MLAKITTATIGIVFLMATAVYAAPRQGNGQGPAAVRKIAPQTRSRIQEQIQVNKNCDGSQIKTRTRNWTNYIR